MFGCLAGQGTVIVSDINEAMLDEGKKRAKTLGAPRHNQSSGTVQTNHSWLLVPRYTRPVLNTERPFVRWLRLLLQSRHLHASTVAERHRHHRFFTTAYV